MRDMNMALMSAMIGALTGGVFATSAVILIGSPLWSILVIYPLVGLIVTLAIHMAWRHYGPSEPENAESSSDALYFVDVK